MSELTTSTSDCGVLPQHKTKVEGHSSVSE